MKNAPAPHATVRLINWQSRLAALVETRQATPFAWGSNDCCLWAADCADACTGVDLVGELRGRYADERAGRRLLKRLGGLAVLASSRLGAEVPPLMAQVGDVGLVADEVAGELLAVWLGAHWAAPGATGLRHIAPAAVTRAWRLCRG